MPHSKPSLPTATDRPCRRRSRTSFSRRPSSASRQTSPSVSCAPPSPASSGSAASQSPTLASTLATASTTELPPCSASFNPVHTSSGVRIHSSSPPRNSPSAFPTQQRGGALLLHTRHGTATMAAFSLGVGMCHPRSSSFWTSSRAAGRSWTRPTGTAAYESLLETGERSKDHSRLHEWSKPCSGLHLGPDADFRPVPPVLIQDTLYFKFSTNDDYSVGILKYDLCSKCLSLIDVPLDAKYDTTILMGMEDGSLGFAHFDELTLNLWSRHMGSDGVGSWSECRVIDLSELFPASNKRLRLIGSVEGGDIIFVTMELGIYKINLKSLECKKIWKKETAHNVIPYMRFYYPQGTVNPSDTADRLHMVEFA